MNVRIAIVVCVCVSVIRYVCLCTMFWIVMNTEAKHVHHISHKIAAYAFLIAL
jgi:hypothetical protein